jgi:hypothetical protein
MSDLGLPDDEAAVYLSNMPYGTLASTIEQSLERDELEYV